MIGLSLQHAIRRLTAVPGFSTAAILTLALGIGATTAVFSVIDAVLLKPLPYREPDRLMFLSHSVFISGISGIDQSDATYLFYRRHNRTFTDIGGYRTVSVNLGGSAAAGDAGQAERVLVGRVSAGLLPLLGVSPLAGRVFTESEDRETAPRVVLIGERVWRIKYGADPSLVGGVLDVDGISHTVVGIMPASFRFPTSDADAWIPLRLDAANTDSASFDYQAVGRLRDGVSAAAAAADLQAILTRVPEEFPGRLTVSSIQQIQMQAIVRPLRDVVLGDISRVLWIVFGAALFVLATACANVTNLFLVRTDARRKELAVRRALGAGSARLVVDLVSEGLVLATFGGALGVGAAAVGIRALQMLGEGAGFARLPEVDVNLTVLATAGAVTILAALFVSGVAAWRYGRASVSLALAQTGQSTTAGRDRHRVRTALVVAQVALALVLLSGAGLMTRTFVRLRAVEPGFAPEHALAFRVAIPSARYGAPADAARFFTQALDDVSALPGVEAVGVVSKLPLDPVGKLDTAVFVEDRPRPPNAMPNIHDVAYVSPGYFAAMRIPLSEGRTLERADPDRPSREVVVSRGFAERYWKGESAIGKRVRILVNGPWFTVAGVVGPVRSTALEQAPDETIYCSIVPAAADRRWAPRDLAFVVRTTGDRTDALAEIRNVLQRRDPAAPMYGARPVNEIVSQAASRTSSIFFLLVCASVVALILGAVGIYGVMSYAVSLRTREIGVRLALGAQPREVRRLVSRHAMVVVVSGIAVGMLGAAALTRVLASLLFEVSPTDPVTFATAAIVLGAIALVASWVPARRAARIDLLTALRAE